MFAMPILKALKKKIAPKKAPKKKPVVIPELGTPERVQYEVAIRDTALRNVKTAREAHNRARASR